MVCPSGIAVKRYKAAQQLTVSSEGEGRADGRSGEVAAEVAAFAHRLDDLTRRFDALLERLGESID